MRRLVMISCVFLTLSGGWLTTASEFLKVERSTTVAVLHIWAGFFFLVIFPMYSLDHIKAHAYRLRRIVQLLAGIGLILSGVLLWLYGVETLSLPREVHIILTVVLVASLLTHFRAPK
jgi:hypothetical protein